MSQYVIVAVLLSGYVLVGAMSRHPVPTRPLPDRRPRTTVVNNNQRRPHEAPAILFSLRRHLPPDPKLKKYSDVSRLPEYRPQSSKHSAAGSIPEHTVLALLSHFLPRPRDPPPGEG